MPTHSPEESKRYREKHKEDLKIRKRLEYLKHKDAYIARAAKNEKIRLATPEGRRKRQISWRRTNQKPAKRIWKKAYMAQYRAENRSKFTEYERRRNAQKLGAVCEKIDYEALYKASPFCFYCGKPLKRDQMHFDHYIPLSKGGEHVASNIKPACGPCNMSKHDKMPQEFILSQ